MTAEGDEFRVLLGAPVICTERLGLDERHRGRTESRLEPALHPVGVAVFTRYEHQNGIGRPKRHSRDRFARRDAVHHFVGRRCDHESGAR
jgi:hypothetical protein